MVYSAFNAKTTFSSIVVSYDEALLVFVVVLGLYGRG